MTFIVASRSVKLLLALFLAAALAVAEERTIFFWRDEITDAIHAHVDGVAALETIRELGRFHRVHGSPGFAAAAEHLAGKLRAAGLRDAAVERFPADGSTRYGHFRSYYGWTASTATLEEVSPRPRVIASFPHLPVALADYSQDADVTAELVDVGMGTDARHYERKSIEGKLLLASGPLPLVHRRGCEERGAAGFLSDFPNQQTAWSGEDRDLVRWGHLSPYQLKNRFAFMLSKRQSEQYRARLAAGEKIVLRAVVRAQMVPGSYDVVTATIPGTDRSSEEIILTAHLCHQSAGANDNASGSAVIFEIARALQSAISRGKLFGPRRTLRFLWLPEIAGPQAYLSRHPDTARRMVAGVHMDMVGGVPATIRGTFHVSRAAATLPHVVNEIAETWMDAVIRASARLAERGGELYDGYVWPPGGREMFLGDVRDLETGSDHQVFQESSYGIPMVYFHDWPDVTIHTNKDQPENMDATKLGRVAFLGAGIAWTLAALPDAEAARLVPLVRASSEVRIARAKLRGAEDPASRDSALFLREAIAVSSATLRSVAALWPPTSSAAGEEIKRLEALLPTIHSAAAQDARVPVRSEEVRGPLNVYYYDHLREMLGPDAETATALVRREKGEVLAYEALNLVDGKRTVMEIRDILTGRYDPVPVREIAEYFETLARAKVLRWR